ncbi:hypothetical protein RBB50_008212 [Rhinocladiella similis]
MSAQRAKPMQSMYYVDSPYNKVPYKERLSEKFYHRVCCGTRFGIALWVFILGMIAIAVATIVPLVVIRDSGSSHNSTTTSAQVPTYTTTTTYVPVSGDTNSIVPTMDSPVTSVAGLTTTSASPTTVIVASVPTTTDAAMTITNRDVQKPEKPTQTIWVTLTMPPPPPSSDSFADLPILLIPVVSKNSTPDPVEVIPTKILSMVKPKDLGTGTTATVVTALAAPDVAVSATSTSAA